MIYTLSCFRCRMNFAMLFVVELYVAAGVRGYDSYNEQSCVFLFKEVLMRCCVFSLRWLCCLVVSLATGKLCISS